ncbi:oligopeptide transporter 5-like [Pistacia vera]|uniref:oligopeptide transporter 5-like n=1 Tax=Pistacia vera TaxID=55513 RepID=UPI001262B275|nr:oligopeptide transporter 5-like [Pistacia vera]
MARLNMRRCPQSRNPSSEKIIDFYAGDYEVNDSPIEQVKLTVPITDNPSEPVLTFRTWVLGLTSCALLAFLNRFFSFRQNPLSVGPVAAQIIVLPIGRLMASTLPTKVYQCPLTKWRFSLNPGPFSVKEHALITIFAGCGAGGVYAVHIVIILKAFYKRSLHPVAALLLAQTTQLLGYGWAGLFRKVLVDSPYMWWPQNLPQVSLFRALHEEQERPRGGVSRLQFFIIILVSSFAYYTVPGYLFPSLSALSFICWIWTDSVTMQQIGSGLNGLGIGSFGLDWSTVASFLSSPLAFPLFAIVNMLIGFILVIYVMLPIAYWTNIYDAKRFPIFSCETFDYSGQVYNVSRILNQKTFDLDVGAYNSYSRVYVSVLFALNYGLSFAGLVASLSHVALFDGKHIWQTWGNAKSESEEFGDVHTRLMKKYYDPVPHWWFHACLITSIVFSLIACEGFDKALQLPWWGFLLSVAVSFIFTLPVSVITATTNQAPGLNVITEMIIGYLYPGRPIANVTFKTYGTISTNQAISFLSDLKLGHYMKIPPKSMFIVQLAGTIVASSFCFGTAWWLLESVENICDKNLLPEGSPWTCPGDDVFYSASIIWGVVGPGRMFTSAGNYPEMNWFFLIGLLLPVPGWYLARKFPTTKWLGKIHWPIILGATSKMPPTRAVHFWSWGAVGLFFNYYIFRKYKTWWARHTYILSAALDAGLAFMGVFLYFALQGNNIEGPHWWGNSNGDHCPLATCPTSPGIKVEGCPVF